MAQNFHLIPMPDYGGISRLFIEPTQPHKSDHCENAGKIEKDGVIIAKSCFNRFHSSQCENFNRDEVPIEYFYENPENPNGREYKVCSFCRVHYKKYSKYRHEIMR